MKESSSNCKEGTSSSSSSSSTSCFSSCCSSSVLMLVVVPLILVSAGFVCAISGPDTWDSLCYHPWLCSSSSTKREGDTSPSSFSPSDPLPSSIETKIDSNSTRSSSLGNKESDHANDEQRHVDHVQQEEEAEILSDAFKNSSSSSSPPEVAETIQIQVPKHDEKTKEGGSKTYMNTSEAVVVGVVPETTRVIQRQHTKLQKLEAGLARARAAIREEVSQNQIRNQTISDPDYVPMGPMYWNSHVFHRSYLEMEKQFKIFIYEEGEPPLFHSGPCKSIYSMEGNFIHSMEMETHYRTRDPNKAHAYFLPFSVAMMVRYVYIPNSHDITPIKKTVIDYVNVIGSKYPYWNRSFGADHFMLSCHDWGPVTSSYIPYLFKNSIRALCNANTSEGFTPSKDVSFPEINLKTGDTNGWIGGPSPSQRPILAFFAGGLHGPIRPVLLEHWENKDNDIRVYKYLPKGISYHNMMQNSKYCICPSGYEVASPRIVEAIYTGCVPVLISDNYVPPFSDVLNWKTFSVEVPVSEIPNLKSILMGISSRQYIRMQRRGVQVRKHFEVNSPPKRFDVFHMILHSIWLRRLNVQINDQ